MEPLAVFALSSDAAGHKDAKDSSAGALPLARTARCAHELAPTSGAARAGPRSCSSMREKHLSL
eukprot:7256385-Prymnesium_polylepis.1